MTEYAKVWKDEGKLKAGFFEQGTLLEEIPVTQLNHSQPEQVIREIGEAHQIQVRAGYEVEK